MKNTIQKDSMKTRKSIRTYTGEMRISNFMIWQIAYSEFWVTPVLWPDFDKNNLVEAIINFQKRVRKYGGKV